MNYTNATESGRYLYLWNKNEIFYAVPKSSNYKALKGQLSLPKSAEIIGVGSRDYNSEFSSSENQIIALVDTNGDGSKFGYIQLGLGTIRVQCYPLTSLLAFLKREEQYKISFTITGVNDKYASIPEVRFTFNVFYIYSYGKIGTVFWIWLWAVVNVVLFVFFYRLVRLGLKRKSQSARFNKVRRDLEGTESLLLKSATSSSIS